MPPPHPDSIPSLIDVVYTFLSQFSSGKLCQLLSISPDGDVSFALWSVQRLLEGKEQS